MAASSSPRRTARSAFCSISAALIARILPNAGSRRENWLRRGKQAARAALVGELLQPVNGAGKARREAESAESLRVVPAVCRELLEEVRLEARRRDRGLAFEREPPPARDAPVEWTPE